MPAPSPARVSVRGAIKRYGAVTALAGVDLDIDEGGIFGLLGPNGAGKTTLLECILGLRRPDSGSIRIGEIDAIEHPERSKEYLGAQLQDAALQDKVTPRQALRLFGSFYPDPTPAPELLRRFGLEDKADTAFDSLSGGQKQRLFLALAFVNRPRLVVLDEPTSGLDPQSRRDLHHAIRGMRESGRTVLLSTHDLAEAQQLCDCIGILDHGTLVAHGTPDELIRSARSAPRLAFRAAVSPVASELAALSDVIQVEQEGRRWVLSTPNPNRTLFALVAHLGDAQLQELEIRHPTLEDVFFERTGRPWEKEAVK